MLDDSLCSLSTTRELILGSTHVWVVEIFHVHPVIVDVSLPCITGAWYDMELAVEVEHDDTETADTEEKEDP